MHLLACNNYQQRDMYIHIYIPRRKEIIKYWTTCLMQEAILLFYLLLFLIDQTLSYSFGLLYVLIQRATSHFLKGVNRSPDPLLTGNPKIMSGQ